MKFRAKPILLFLAFALTTFIFVKYLAQNLNENSELVSVNIEENSEKPVTREEFSLNNADEIIKEINSDEIWDLTDEKIVIPYLKKHQRLPYYYITKNEARKLGWIASEGNLCEALPGKAIGGDRFGNREGKLPKKSGRLYFEADLNYKCGRRNADRVVYSNDGLIFLTKDHYKTFQKQ